MPNGDKGYQIYDFLRRHWGEIYTGIDIASNIFKAMSSSGDVPDTIDPRIRGVVGLLGLKDERDFLLKIRALKRRLNSEAKFRRTMGYFAWEIGQAKNIEARLGSWGAKVILTLYLNRLRTLFAGMLDTPDVELESWKRTTREGQRTDATATTTTSTGKVMGGGSQPGVDVLEMLANEINRNWLSLSKVKLSDEARLERAFQMTRDMFHVAGLPRMPDPDRVPDLVAFKNWLVRNGGLPLQLIESLATDEICAIEHDMYRAWLRLQQRKARPSWPRRMFAKIPSSWR
jgi:hypothetical protein